MLLKTLGRYRKTTKQLNNNNNQKPPPSSPLFKKAPTKATIVTDSQRARFLCLSLLCACGGPSTPTRSYFRSLRLLAGVREVVPAPPLERPSGADFRPAPSRQALPCVVSPAGKLSVMALSSRLWRLLPPLRVCQQTGTRGSRGRCGAWGVRACEVTRCPGPRSLHQQGVGGAPSPGLEVPRPGPRVVELPLCKPPRRQLAS